MSARRIAARGGALCVWNIGKHEVGWLSFHAPSVTLSHKSHLRLGSWGVQDWQGMDAVFAIDNLAVEVDNWQRSSVLCGIKTQGVDPLRICCTHSKFTRVFLLGPWSRFPLIFFL